MIRIVSPCSVWATTRSLPHSDMPNVMYRDSAAEWSGSEPVAAKGSLKAVAASSNETRCFRRFERAFRGSHSSIMLASCHDANPSPGRAKAKTLARSVMTCPQDHRPEQNLRAPVQSAQGTGQGGFHQLRFHKTIVPVIAVSSSRRRATARFCPRAGRPAGKVARDCASEYRAAVLRSPGITPIMLARPAANLSITARWTPLPSPLHTVNLLSRHDPFLLPYARRDEQFPYRIPLFLATRTSRRNGGAS